MKDKTIIFDFDGTIANSLPFHFKKVLEIVDKYHITDLDHKKVIEEVRSKSHQELMKKFKLSWLKLPFFLSIVRQAQKELYKEIDKIKIFPGMKKTLVKLKKKSTIGILSSNIQENIDKFLSANKLEIFDFVHCESNIFGKDKALNHLIKKYSLEKKKVYYVGDEVRDIEACKKAKVKIISVGWGIHNKKLLKANKPDYFVEKPEEIMQILVDRGESRPRTTSEMSSG